MVRLYCDLPVFVAEQCLSLSSCTQLTRSRSDYINPIDLCNRLNTYIVPEAAVHALLTFLFIINGYWIAIILNLPLLAWNAKKIFENQHLLDATEIFRKLNVHKKVGITQALQKRSTSIFTDPISRNHSSSLDSTLSCSSSTCTA